MKNSIESKDQILKIIRNNQEAIRDFGVSEIGLFGSFARDEQKEDSDIDLIVKFKHGKKSYMKFIDLSEYLEKLFNRKVDLLTEKSINRHMKSKIINETVYVSVSN